MISKYPIISENNKKYKVKFKRYSNNSIHLSLCKRIAFIDFCLASSFVGNSSQFYETDLILEVRKIIEMYEHKIGIGRTTPISIVKFIEWDGELESLEMPKPPARPVTAKK